MRCKDSSIRKQGNYVTPIIVIMIWHLKNRHDNFVTLILNTMWQTKSVAQLHWMKTQIIETGSIIDCRGYRGGRRMSRERVFCQECVPGGHAPGRPPPKSLESCYTSSSTAISYGLCALIIPTYLVYCLFYPMAISEVRWLKAANQKDCTIVTKTF